MGRLIDRPTLERSEAEAQRCGVAIHDVLLATGRVSEMDYTNALAHWLGVHSVFWGTQIDLEHDADTEFGLPARIGGEVGRLLVATRETPDDLRRRVAVLRGRGVRIALVPRSVIEASIERHTRDRRIDKAIRGLFRWEPKQSAARGTELWQIVAVAFLVGLAIGGLSVSAEITIAVLTALVALPFLCVTALRVIALREVLGDAPRLGPPPGTMLLPDDLLPIYTVLVPLFREANVLPGLVQALRVLDYPAAKLEVLIVLEAVDAETQAALLSVDLPGNFRTIVVPPGQPQTKPKALNYALQFARGDYVVVYDAEDRPQPDQLRRALEVFRHAPADLGCVQARLNIYNPWQSWFTRQFTIEYSALFDAILPALERLRLPVPLGGTSNHFPKHVLLAVGAWDAFNVTEDADLGMRLARRGFRTAVLASTTWEEAPAAFVPWLGQRTRWLKGWMQTYLVHTRQPLRLAAELGLRGTVGLHVLMGGFILSALVHPLFYALLAHHAVSGNLFAPPETAAGIVLWWVACINLNLGYLTSMLVGIIAVWRRGRPALAASALFMPVTWLLISLAAYRALYELVRDPYLWRKTSHGVSPQALRGVPTRLASR